MTLTIGILTNETGRFGKFWQSFTALRTPKQTNVVIKTSIDIAENRNTVIRESRHSDFVWFIDDDHTFEPDLIENLLLHNAPVVQPLVLTRFTPFGPVMMGEQTVEGRYKKIALDNSRQRGLLEVTGVGAAGMLIRRDVLQKVGDPWFTQPLGRIAEDVMFCEKVRAAGFKIYSDLSNSMGHLNVGSVRPVVRDGKWVTELVFGEKVIYLQAVEAKC